MHRAPSHRLVLALLLAATAFALAGCETLLVATGARMRLDGVPLRSIAASLPGDGRLSPGASARLSVVATTTDGRTLASVGTGDGKVLLDSYVFEASVATVDADGVVRLPADPRLSEGRTPHVRPHAAGQATPVAELDIPLHYDVAYTTTYAGRDGGDGTDGLDGLAGPPGGTGSFDPESPSAGGDGGDGGNGTDGDHGEDGSPGPDVRVAIALAPGAHPLLRVRAIESGHDRFFLVDPDGGSLALAVRGGHAGQGGRGGRAGPGGSGGAGSPPGMGGRDGLPGHDGLAGSAGAAGRVEVAVDPAAARYLDRFRFTNVDGDGRPGPAPAITLAPVALAW